MNISTNDVKIRKFHMGDYNSVINLWQICGLNAKPNGRDHYDKMAKEITKETAQFLVAELDGQIIGTVLATHDGRKGWINRLAVSPDYQHQGVAQILLKEAEDILYNLDLEIIACLIEDYNDPSMNFFQKSGYKKHTDIFYFTKRNSPDT